MQPRCLCTLSRITRSRAGSTDALLNAWQCSLELNSNARQWLREAGCPVEGLHFDPDLVTRGLIVDKALGNLLKVRMNPT